MLDDDADFTMVSEAAHGSATSLEVGIDRVTVVAVEDDLVVATYRESQRGESVDPSPTEPERRCGQGRYAAWLEDAPTRLLRD